MVMSDLDNEQRSPRRLWIFAALCALALHLGGAALAVAHLRGSEPDDLVGAEAIEVGVELTSVQREPTDLPAGPDTEASVASAAIAEQKAEVKQTDLPKETPTETADPDREVTTNESEKQREEESKVAALPTAASAESVAAEAAATPSLNEAPAGRSQAPELGTGRALQRLKASWFAQLSAHFDKHKRNPPLQKFRSASVLVDVTFDRSGHVVASSVAQSSGDPAYDDAALAMVRRSDPVPQPPPAVADQGLHFTLPVNFHVKGRS
jgi:TonB family protein